MDNDDRNDMQDALERILRDAPLEAIDKAGGRGADADALWATLEDNGFTRLCAAEEHDGLGLDLATALPLVALCGRQAVAAPVGDTILATALLSRAGIAPPPGRIGVLPPDTPVLPHGAQCAHAIALRTGAGRPTIALLSLPDGAVSAGFKTEDGAGALDLHAAKVITESAAPDWLTRDSLQALGAVIRVAAMSGALQAALDLTLAYTSEREQFGRRLAAFQAIQHHLADMACEAAAAAAALDLAADALAGDPELVGSAHTEIASAKIRCGLAATRATAAAHQAHGAMGFTREYALGRFTRRLWQWQDEFGTTSDWAIGLGRTALGQQGTLWDRLSA